MKIIILSSLILISASLVATPIVHEFKNPSFSGKGTGPLLDHRKPRTFKKEGNRRSVGSMLESGRERQIIHLAKFIKNLESRIYAQMAKQLVESMFSNDNAVRFGSFVLEGNTVTYEVITNEDGSEFIRMTIVGSDGTETVIEIPIGTGNYGQRPRWLNIYSHSQSYYLVVHQSLDSLVNHKIVTQRHGVMNILMT